MRLRVRGRNRAASQTVEQTDGQIDRQTDRQREQIDREVAVPGEDCGVWYAGSEKEAVAEAVAA